MTKVMIIGLDCATPSIVFDKKLSWMPNLQKLLHHSIYGPLESSNPPITVPAWMTMAPGRTPGELGVYGFRHRKTGSYNKSYIASSNSIKGPAVWDLLGKYNKRQEIVVVSGLPRSGTSMMMKMLEAGGLQPLTDYERSADEDNPKGYYEFERVKKLKESDYTWLPQAQGKVV